MKIDGDF